MKTLAAFAGIFLLCAPSFGADVVSPKKKPQPQKTPTNKVQAIPFLGPGADKLPPEEYVKIYRTYIQQSMLLGYPFMEEAPTACEQSLKTLFRQAGLYTYPVPQDLDRLERVKKNIGASSLESYWIGGQLLQVERDGKSQALHRVLWVNSSSPKAMKLLWGAAKQVYLSLVRDPKTGLERLQNLPVGYPHPYIDVSSQGIFVRELKYNGKLAAACSPIGFVDNAWTSGFALSDERCGELRSDIDLVWQGKLRASDFAEKERKRMVENSIKNAMANGIKRDEAEKIVAKNMVPPFNHEVTLVGGAMRNLGQCNLLAIGGKAAMSSLPKDQEGTATGTSATGHGGGAQ